MAILFNNNGYGNESWRLEINKQLPEYQVRQFGDDIDIHEIEYAMVWNNPAGDLQRYPNLRAIFSLGAGA